MNKYFLSLRLCFDKISRKKLAEFTRQLATLCHAKIDLSQALFIIIQEENNFNLKKIIISVRNEIENGMSFSESLARFPQYFDKIYCGLVAAGEKSGALENILLQLSAYQENSLEVRAKITKALFYPSIVAAAAVLLTAGLLIFVAPQFINIFNSFGAQLPIFTQLVISISKIFQNYTMKFFGAMMVFLFSYQYAVHRWVWWKTRQDRFLLQLPVIGSLLTTTLLSAWARLLATLLNANISLLESLQIAGKIITNRLLQTVMEDIIIRVSSGSAFAQALAAHERWFRSMIQMITVGENAGQLVLMLEKVADIQKKALDQRVDYLSKWLEPAIMIILAGITGSLIIAMYLPVFQLGKIT